MVFIQRKSDAYLPTFLSSYLPTFLFSQPHLFLGISVKMASFCSVAAERETVDECGPRNRLSEPPSESSTEQITLPTELAMVPVGLEVPLHANFPCQGPCFCYQYYIRRSFDHD